MQNFEQTAQQTFLSNLDFFQSNHPEVYQKIEEYEANLTAQTAQEHYALDYIDGYFDVQQLSSKNYLYGENSHHISKELAKRVNYKKNSYIFDGFMMFHNYEEHKESFDDKTKGFEDIFPLMTYYLDHITPENEMIEIEKFIFIGTGLGEHIVEIDKKIHAQEYFIIEDDIELFRLSLFVTPYYKLTTATLIFSIADSKEHFTKKFKQFLENSFFRNKYLKYSYFPAHSDEKIKLIKNALASQVFATFPYKTLLYKYLQPLKYIKEGYKFLNLGKHFPLSEITQKPLLIIAAGPSLDTNLEWLKEHHQNFTILALSATLKLLYKHHIVPDIVTHIDGFSISKQHFEGFAQQEFLKNSIALFGSFVPKEILHYFNKENIYITEDIATFYHKDFSAPSGPCVGSTSLMWALNLGFESIYLLGLDFALGDDGSSHSKTHQLTQQTYDVSNDLTQEISFRGDFFDVQGNFKKSVKTLPLFYSSIHAMFESLPLLKDASQQIYNLNDGAYIATTTPLHTTEVKLTQIKNAALTHKQLTELFTPYTQTKLDKSDIDSLRERYNFAQESYEYLTSKSDASPAQEPNRYLHELISTALFLLREPTRENANLVTVFEYYLSYTMPIIFDFFNTKELDNYAQHIQVTHKIFYEGLISISKIYKETRELGLI